MASNAPKWTRQPDQRPGQIMDAALEVFARKGFQGATMDEVARDAGVTKGTIYLYFASKEAVFLETVRREVEEMASLLSGIDFSGADSLEDMARTVARQLVREVMTPRVARLVPLVVGEVNHMPALRRMYQEELLPKANLQLAEVLEGGMALGLLRPLDPVITARALLGMFLTFVLTQEVFGAKAVTAMDPDRIADTIVEIFLRGVIKGS